MPRKGTFEARLADRKLRRDIKRAERMVGQFGHNVKSTLSGSFKGGLATVGSFAAVGGLSSQLQDGMKYQTTLQRLGDQAKYSTAKISGLDKQVRGHATSWGLTNSEMLEATGQLVNLQGAGALTGDNMAFLGEAMTATGASAANTARVMSALMDQGVKTPEEMRGAFDALIEAGDAGNIPFDLMANNLSSILPMVKGLVSEGKQGHAEVGGLLQVLGKVTGGDISQAQTLLKAMVNNLDQSKKKLRKAGFKDLFDKKGNLRSLYEIRGRLGDLAKNKKLIKLITSSEARSAIKAIGAYRDTWEDVTKAAAASHATERKARSFMQSSAGKWRKALADIKNKFHEAMTPERIESVANAAEKFVAVLGFASDHLDVLVAAWAAWKGLGLVRYIGDVAGAMQKLGGVSKVAGSALGAIKGAGSLGLIGAVGGATYAIGTYADQVLGLSDKLAGIEPADTRSNLQKGHHLEAKAESTRDWLKGVHSGAIDADAPTKALVAKRIRGEALTDDERDTLKWQSKRWTGFGWEFDYDEDKQNWEKNLTEAQNFIVPATNQLVESQNAQTRDKVRTLVDSGSAVSTLQEMALRDNADGRVTGEILARFMSERGIDARQREFVRTGDAEADGRLAKFHADNERKSDAALVEMLVEALQQANIQVTADVSVDNEKLVEKMANTQARNRSY